MLLIIPILSMEVALVFIMRAMMVAVGGKERVDTSSGEVGSFASIALDSKVRHTSVIMMPLTMISNMRQMPQGAWIITTVDSSGDVGRYHFNST